VRQWLQALRLRATNEDPRSRFLAVRTARAIAGVCQLSQQNRSEILDVVLISLKTERPAIVSLLVEAFSELAVVDEELVSRALESLDHVYDRTILRQLAQLLMIRNIHLCLSIDTATHWQSEAVEHVRWCRERGVLAEYVAGAKGAYRRALIKRFNRNAGRVPDSLLNDQQKRPGIALDWRELFAHIVDARRGEPDYYHRAYHLARTLIQKRDDEWASFSGEIVTAIVRKILDEEGSTNAQDFLHNLPDNLTELSLSKLVTLRNGSRGLSGWVDRDALEVFQQTFEGDGDWYSLPGELVVQRRIKDSDAAKKEAHLYQKFGIQIKTESHSPTCYACIDTFDAPRTWTVDYAESVVSDEESEFVSTQ